MLSLLTDHASKPSLLHLRNLYISLGTNFFCLGFRLGNTFDLSGLGDTAYRIGNLLDKYGRGSRQLAEVD